MNRARHYGGKAPLLEKFFLALVYAFSTVTFAILFGLILLVAFGGPRPADLAVEGSPLGYTECVGDHTPVAYVNAVVWDTNLEALVKTHERKHIEQIMRFESCKAWNDYYAENKAVAEAEAFVAMIRQGFPMILAAQWLAGDAYDLGMSQADAFVLIWQVSKVTE